MFSTKQSTKITKEPNGSISYSYNYVMNYDRWKAIAAGLYLEFLAGIIYAFPVYATQLKDLLGANQKELNLCSTLGTVGGNFSILAGIYLDIHGSRKTSHLGAFISSFGFLFIYFVTVGTIPGGYIAAAIGYLIAYQGLTWMDMSVVTAMVTNFPKDKGLSVGLVKTQFGLASSAIVILSVGLFGGKGKISQAERCYMNEYIYPSSSNKNNIINITNQNTINDATTISSGLPLLAFFSGLCIVIGTFSSHFLRLTPPTFNNGGKLLKGGMKKMYTIYGCVVFVMCYCLIVSLLNLAWRKVGKPPEGINFIFAIVEIALYTFPYFLILKTKKQNEFQVDDSEENVDNGAINNNNKIGELIALDGKKEEDDEDGIQGNITEEKDTADVESSNSDDNNNDNENIINSRTVQSSMYNVSFFEALGMIEFWCLFFIFFGGTGAAYMTINNLAQINYSLGGTLVKKNYLVILVGVFNCIGRIVMGNIQDVVGSKYGITRPLLCLVAILCVGVSQIILAWTDNTPVGVSLMAFGFGSTWCLIGPVSNNIVVLLKTIKPLSNNIHHLFIYYMYAPHRLLVILSVKKHMVKFSLLLACLQC